MKLKTAHQKGRGAAEDRLRYLKRINQSPQIPDVADAAVEAYVQEMARLGYSMQKEVKLKPLDEAHDPRYKRGYFRAVRDLRLLGVKIQHSDHELQKVKP